MRADISFFPEESSTLILAELLEGCSHEGDRLLRLEKPYSAPFETFILKIMKHTGIAPGHCFTKSATILVSTYPGSKDATRIPSFARARANVFEREFRALWKDKYRDSREMDVNH